MKFTVNRRHYGDRLYEPGETREAVEGDVRHLVERGVLEPEGGKSRTKAKRAPANKAAPESANKAD